MIYKTNSKLFLTVLVLALIVTGLAFLVGNQNFNFPTRAASFTDDKNNQLLTAAETAGTYSIDSLHTNIGFRVRHMGLAIVLGRFTDYTGTISYDPNDITKSSVQFSAKIASLDTGVKQRDDHLRSADFFEVEKFPEMTFRSTRIERKSDKAFIAYGDLKIKNVNQTDFSSGGILRRHQRFPRPNQIRRFGPAKHQPAGLRHQVESDIG